MKNTSVWHSFEEKMKPQLCFFLKKPSLVLIFSYPKTLKPLNATIMCDFALTYVLSIAFSRFLVAILKKDQISP